MIRLVSKAMLASAALAALVGCAAFAPCDCPRERIDPGDEVLPARSALTGAWVSAQRERPMTIYIHAAGDFTLQAKKSGGRRGGYARGHWTLEGRTFTGSVDSSGIPSLPAGHRWSDTVVHLSSTDLILSTPSGQIERYWREGTE